MMVGTVDAIAGKVEREKETKEATVIVEKGKSVEDGGGLVEWRDY